MFLLEIFAYAIIGVIAGLFAGLLGISGGIVTVPLLVLIFSLIGVPQDMIMHLAIGTSLAAMVFNAFSSAWAHNKRGSVVWKVVKRMFIGIILGSLCGAYAAHLIPDVFLEVIFGLFACCLGLYMLKGAKLHQEDHPLPGAIVLNSVGFSISAVSNILGIGGGIITVPSLMHFKIHEKKAIGTSAATGAVITLLGALFYMFFGLQENTEAEPGTIGYLYLPAFIVISIATFFAAPFDAYLTQLLPAKTLRRIFAAALFATGLSMLFNW